MKLSRNNPFGVVTAGLLHHRFVKVRVKGLTDGAEAGDTHPLEGFNQKTVNALVAFVNYFLAIGFNFDRFLSPLKVVNTGQDLKQDFLLFAAAQFVFFTLGTLAEVVKFSIEAHVGFFALLQLLLENADFFPKLFEFLGACRCFGGGGLPCCFGNQSL